MPLKRARYSNGLFPQSRSGQLSEARGRQRVIRSLEQIICWRGSPGVIWCDHWPEYISATLQNWANRRGIRIEYIHPGNPQQNAYVRDSTGQHVMSGWRIICLSPSMKCSNSSRRGYGITNHERPNMALGGITPNQRLAMAA